jgi:hypothetical protein
MGFDWVWLLSVWRTGPAGQRVSRENHEWRREFEDTLPDVREEDIVGSGSRSPAIRSIQDWGAIRRWRGCASVSAVAGSG